MAFRDGVCFSFNKRSAEEMDAHVMLDDSLDAFDFIIAEVEGARTLGNAHPRLACRGQRSGCGLSRQSSLYQACRHRDITRRRKAANDANGPH
jgi:hypothetical protein